MCEGDEQGNIMNKNQAANCFMKQYKSVGNIEVEYNRKQEVQREIRALKGKDTTKAAADETMTKNITEEEINAALKSLTMNKAPGPDDITNNMLVNLGNSAKKKMRQIFNASWKSGRLPQIWKQATMIPIKKDGKPSNKPGSYRPISLTSCLGKLMERIINTRLLWYLERNKIISNEQAGFRSFRSTEDQVTYITQQIEDSFQEKKHTLTVWVDMEKAFDKVWTKGLILKLKRANVSHNMFSWIKNYLTNRTARVKTQNTKSRLTSMRNGVPQGGVLSPTLFILFINDIDKTKCNGVKGAMYADDLALICSESNIGTARARMQLTLDNLKKWTEDWGMRVNAAKTTYTVFSLSTKRSTIKLTMERESLREDPAPKYLGVNFDPRLSWKHQTDECQKKGLRRMQLLRKLAGTTWGANATVLKKTYLGYVRPALEYGIAAWGTCSNAQMNKVEKVQNHCLRIISGAIKTTPIQKMESFTGIKAIHTQRDEKVLTQYTKIKFMDTQPLHQNTKRKTNNRLKRDNFISMGQRLESSNNLTPKQPITQIQVTNGQPTPWNTHLKLTINREKTDKREKEPSHRIRDEVLLNIDRRYPKRQWTRVYTDGSINGPSKKGGAGILIEWNDQSKNRTELSVPVGEMSTSSKAEEKAILVGIEELAKNVTLIRPNIVFLTDSDETLRALQNPRSRDCHNIIQSLKQITKYKKIEFQWIPGHVGIEGNETADLLAKEATTQQQPESHITFPQQKSLIKQTLVENWNKSHPEYNKTDPINSLQRRSQVTLFRLRTGHNRLKQHMYTKLGLANTPYCSCGHYYENTEHVLMHCPLYKDSRKIHWPTPTPLHTKLYGGPEDLQRTADFVVDIGIQP